MQRTHVNFINFPPFSLSLTFDSPPTAWECIREPRSVDRSHDLCRRQRRFSLSGKGGRGGGRGGADPEKLFPPSSPCALLCAARVKVMTVITSSERGSEIRHGEASFRQFSVWRILCQGATIYPLSFFPPLRWCEGGLRRR